MQLPDLHTAALENTQRTVEGISDEQWELATPCEDWDVRELLGHIVSGNLWVPELVGGRTIAEVGDRLDGDVLGDDPVGAYRASAKRASDAFQASGAMSAPCAVSYGPVPGEIYCGHRIIDVLIHGWDLAKATGQNSTLPTELVQGCLDVVEPQIDMLAASGMFGGDVDSDSVADAQSRLLAMLGRHP